MHIAAVTSASGDKLSSDVVDQELDLIRTLIPLGEVRRLIPSSRPGKTTHISTLIRWTQRGVRTPDGHRVKLRAIRLGLAWMTTRTWVAEFVAAIATSDAEETPTVSLEGGRSSSRSQSPRMSSEQRRAAERARVELDRLWKGA